MLAQAQIHPLMETMAPADVQVWSRKHIDSGLGKGGILISILQGRLRSPWSAGDTHNREAILDQTPWRKVLTLRFDDIEHKDETENNVFVLFDQSHADKIWEFVKDVEQQEVINVHCAAGISRSVAVGFILADTFGRELVVNSGAGIASMNSHVCAIMKRRMWKEHLGITQ